MALTRHHSVERAWAWAAAFLHAAPIHSHALTFHAAIPLPPDKTALAQATAIYGGHQILTSDEFISLEWLTSFAKSGRQLFMCHALRLLDGWNHLRRHACSIETEATILGRLVFSAGHCAALLPQHQQSTLSSAMQTQIIRLLRLKTTDSTLLRIKAMALLAAADAQQNSSPLHAEAMQLLEQALPQLIASDGGPTSDKLPDYFIWLHALLANTDAAFTPKARNALDRARPFLSMLLDSDGRYCFDAKINPLGTIHTTAALRLAPVSHLAHLAAGKAVVITTPAQLQQTTQLHISANGHTLLEAGVFIHGPDDDQSVQSLESDGDNHGQWFRQSMHDQQRTVYLCAKGDDIRIEDQLQMLSKPNWMRLTISEHAKVSVARNGTQATIALDGRNLWQLTLRGAELKAPTQGNQWLVKTISPRVNWALKRINRSPTRHSKAEVPELPF
jgi:hypothetical protein